MSASSRPHPRPRSATTSNTASSPTHRTIPRPDFWLDHSFDRTGVVSQEIFETRSSASRKPEIRINPATRAVSTDKLGDGEAARITYRWERMPLDATSSFKPRPRNHRRVNPMLHSRQKGGTPFVRLDELLRPGANRWKKSAPTKNRHRSFFETYGCSRNCSESA